MRAGLGACLRDGHSMLEEGTGSGEQDIGGGCHSFERGNILDIRNNNVRAARWQTPEDHLEAILRATSNCPPKVRGSMLREVLCNELRRKNNKHAIQRHKKKRAGDSVRRSADESRLLSAYLSSKAGGTP